METICKVPLTANLLGCIGQPGELYFNKINICHNTALGLII